MVMLPKVTFREVIPDDRAKGGETLWDYEGILYVFVRVWMASVSPNMLGLSNLAALAWLLILLELSMHWSVS